MHKRTYLPGELFGHIRYACNHNGVFLVQCREINPVIQAPTPQGIVNLACAVGCNNHHRRLPRFHSANLRNSNLEVGKQFEQICLKLFVAAIQFIYEQDGSLRISRINGLE